MEELASQTTFKYRFYTKLAQEYNHNHKNSAIYAFIQEDHESSYKRLLQAIEKASGKAEISKILNAAPSYVLLEYYYNQIKDCNSAADYIINVIKIVSSTPKPFVTSDKLTKLIQLMTPFLEIVSSQIKWDNIEKKELFIRSLSSAYNDLDRNCAVSDLEEYLADPLYQQCLKSLHEHLISSSICFDVVNHFYNAGYSLKPSGIEEPQRRGFDKNAKNPRAPRVDKTMNLIEKSYGREAFHSVFHGEPAANYKESRFQLFQTIINKGKSNSIEKWEYYNIFIPLFVDAHSGISMCIAGKNNFDKYYETVRTDNADTFNACNSPCALIILRFTDVADITSDNGLTASISYEVRDQFTDFKLGLISEKEYFDTVYQEYCNEIRATYRTFHQINQLTCIPEEIDVVFRDYFESRHQISPDVRSILNKIDEESAHNEHTKGLAD